MQPCPYVNMDKIISNSNSNLLPCTIQFPWAIDMRPYTAEGIGGSESEDDAPPRPLQYELMGVVVHSGQASAGHYYSYIRKRRCVCGRGRPRVIGTQLPILHSCDVGVFHGYV